jgi:hypothetical protein
MSIETDDLRAAVAAGILTEAQAASIKALSEQRQGLRANMPAEDEPFEFFKGFSEIFVSVGLALLMAGAVALLAWLGGLSSLTFIPMAVAAIAWWWAMYFTLKRRMNLPSMLLAVTFGTAIFVSAGAILAKGGDLGRITVLVPALVAMAGMALWYRVFRLPFSAFVLGGFGLVAIYALTGSPESVGSIYGRGIDELFDLRNSFGLALATLIFGIIAFLAGMWFDTRDPNRLGRYAATAFWLHLLAAPALVNTVALTLYNLGGSTGMLATAAALAFIALLALVIDRRSFLTAGLAYLALVIAWAIQGEDGGSFGDWVAILLILGATVTALGTWWIPIRRAVMRALPDFPGKSKLPPFVSL